MPSWLEKSRCIQYIYKNCPRCLLFAIFIRYDDPNVPFPFSMRNPLDREVAVEYILIWDMYMQYRGYGRTICTRPLLFGLEHLSRRFGHFLATTTQVVISFSVNMTRARAILHVPLKIRMCLRISITHQYIFSQSLTSNQWNTQVLSKIIQLSPLFFY